jgi:hypothetical protein
VVELWKYRWTAREDVALDWEEGREGGHTVVAGAFGEEME